MKEKLFNAVEDNNVGEVEKLVTNEEKIKGVINEKTNGLTLLHLAVANNCKEVLYLLLKSGANPEEVDEYGNNSFHYAAKRGNLEVLKLLAEYTKEKTINAINAKNRFKWSVLYSAAEGLASGTKNWAVIGWLLEKGSDYGYTIEDDFSVESVLSQKDWSYAENYRKILEEFRKKTRDLVAELEVSPWHYIKK